MKSFLWAAGVVVTLAGVAFACSSSPNHPPIDTSGGKNPGPSPGGALPKSDGGTAVSEDAGVPVGPSADGGLEGGVCTAGNCSGCCDPINHCQTGTLNAACGVLGVMCVLCTTGQTCSGGYCQ